MKQEVVRRMVESMSVNLDEVRVIAEIVFHISAIVGGVFAFARWGMSKKTTRSRYLKVLLGEYNKDAIQDFCIEIERDRETNGELVEFESAQIKNMRKTLRFFAYVCQALNVGLINQDEFGFFESQIKYVLADKRVSRVVMQGYRNEVSGSAYKASSFPPPATVTGPPSTTPARAATTGPLRRIRAAPTSRGTSTSIRSTSVGAAAAASAGSLFVLSEDLPNSARIAHVFDSF